MSCNFSGISNPVFLFPVPLFNTLKKCPACIPRQNFSPAPDSIRRINCKSIISIQSYMLSVNRSFCCTNSGNVFQIRRPFDWNIIRRCQITTFISWIFYPFISCFFSYRIDPVQSILHIGDITSLYPQKHPVRFCCCYIRWQGCIGASPVNISANSCAGTDCFTFR